MNETNDIFSLITRNISEGKPFVLATIVQTAGSSPRHTGARMLIYPDGSISGTIGGGKFEKMVIEDSVKLLDDDQQTLFKNYKFTGDAPDSTGMTCGGEAKVFMEKFGKPRRLIVFGGGHIGRDLVKIARDLDFSITVVDDREDILGQYDSGIAAIHTDSEYSQGFPELDKDCYVVIVTRGHNCDRNVLAKVIQYDCAYIGMIGSKQKVAKVYGSLKDAGIDESRLSAVHAPVGLDIGAEGPYEIAVSIAAELIAAAKKKLEAPK